MGGTQRDGDIETAHRILVVILKIYAGVFASVLLKCLWNKIIKYDLHLIDCDGKRFNTGIKL